VIRRNFFKVAAATLFAPLIPKENMPVIDLKITRAPIVGKPRKLKQKWVSNDYEDLDVWYSKMSKQIAEELDEQIIRDLSL